MKTMAQAFMAAAMSVQTMGQITQNAVVPLVSTAGQSELAEAVQRFGADREALRRAFPLEASPARRERFERFYREWLASIAGLGWEGLSPAARVDAVLLRNLAEHELRALELDARKRESVAGLTPFSARIVALAEARRTLTRQDPSKVADALGELKAEIGRAHTELEARLTPTDGRAAVSPSDARRAMLLLESLQGAMREWNGFSAGYDPLFTWWTAEPFKAADGALDGYIRLLREKGVGITPENPNVIVGMPIGAEALRSELDFEMIPYTPEELIAIAEREFAWCEAEYRKASAEMGLGDDWRAALDRVKGDHVQPGDQPRVIRELALEAIEYLKANDLLTIPPVAEETWRMEMMTPERQLVNPFFTGGEVISVSFPTEGMAHEAKQMSLRGNNIHFARATVHHELIPGHHLQQFMCARYRPYRAPFETAFWTEGWALYWEMVLWDRGFAKGPENRVGMLFWRSHRCARIVCSLKFHLGQMTSQEWVDFLVERVGHERANAEGEVRRSVSGDYGPLYQVAYMIGGLQFRSLHAELVGGGKMTDRQFHDAVLRENNIPVEMVRAILTGQALSPGFRSAWRFDPVGGDR